MLCSETGINKQINCYAVEFHQKIRKNVFKGEFLEQEHPYHTIQHKTSFLSLYLNNNHEASKSQFILKKLKFDNSL